MELSLQMYAVRHEAARNLALVLDRTRELGIMNLEMARIALTRKNLETIINAEGKGMKVLSHQLRYEKLREGAAIDFLRKEGCRTAVLSVIPTPCWGNGERFRIFLRKLGELGREYGNWGITLAYHHHNYEAIPFAKGETGFDILLEELPRNGLKLIADTYWLQRSGYSPEKFIGEHAEIIEGIHLRDYKVERRFCMPRVADTLPPQGILDTDSIIREAEKSGVKYMAIEADTKTPFKDIGIFMEYWKKQQKERNI